MSEIIVRHAEAGDYAQVHQIYSHPSIYSDTLQLPFPSLKTWQKRLETETEGEFWLVACSGEQIVGQLTLRLHPNMRRRHVATFGMGVHHAFHGKGVGSALLQSVVDLCDKWLNVLRIELTVFTDNDAALALYKKFGFEIEGTSPCFAMRDGKLVDAYHMGRVVSPR